MSKEDAIQKLKILKAEAIERHGNFDGRELADFIYVDYREGGLIGYSRWQFAIALENDRVVSHFCTFGTVAP